MMPGRSSPTSSSRSVRRDVSGHVGRSLDDDGEAAGVERGETRREIGGGRRVDGHAQQTCELAREPRHAALLPVRAGREHLFGERFDDPGTIVADDRQDQGH